MTLSLITPSIRVNDVVVAPQEIYYSNSRVFASPTPELFSTCSSQSARVSSNAARRMSYYDGVGYIKDGAINSQSPEEDEGLSIIEELRRVHSRIPTKARHTIWATILFSFVGFITWYAMIGADPIYKWLNGENGMTDQDGDNSLYEWRQITLIMVALYSVSLGLVGLYCVLLIMRQRVVLANLDQQDRGQQEPVRTSSESFVTMEP